MNELKHDNFKRISESRKQKLISLLNQISNLSNYSFYEYTEEEILELFNDIDKTSEDVKKHLLSVLKQRNRKSKL